MKAKNGTETRRTIKIFGDEIHFIPRTRGERLSLVLMPFAALLGWKLGMHFFFAAKANPIVDVYVSAGLLVALIGIFCLHRSLQRDKEAAGC